MINFHRSLCLLSVIIGFTSTADAQVILGPDGPQNPNQKNVRRPNEPVTYRLTITPAPEPDPPLKHTLYPRWGELQSGNSVPMWYRALDRIEGSNPAMMPMFENSRRWFPNDWLETPFEEIRPFLETLRPDLANARMAAFRDRTEWDTGLRDARGMETIAFSLGEFQSARQLAKILSLRIRLHLLDGEFDEALEDLAICFRLARDVAEPETFINDLIGIAITAISEENVRHLISLPGSPNLYWALSDLPQPLIDIRDAIAAEMTLPERLFPWMNTAATSNRSASEWHLLLVDAVDDLIELQDYGSQSQAARSDLQLQTMLLGLGLRGFPQAKADLIADGMDPSVVDKMPVGQVLVLQEHSIYLRVFQSAAAAMSLPADQSIQRIDQQSEKFHKQGVHSGGLWRGREALPFATMILPVTSQMKEAQIRRESMRAALMNVEAIRMHLVESDGQLPKSLEEITVVPVPVDPRTQEPFPYVLNEDVAVLDVFARHYDQRFEIRVADSVKD